jgi:hypothetical protein
VVDLSGLLVGATVDETLLEERARDVELNDRAEGGTTLFEQRSEAVSLGNGARKPVEEEPRLAVVVLEATRDEAQDGLVGNETATVHDGEILRVERAGALRRAQHVARRDLGDPEALADELGLRPLARARGAYEDDDLHCSLPDSTRRRARSRPAPPELVRPS